MSTSDNTKWQNVSMTATKEGANTGAQFNIAYKHFDDFTSPSSKYCA